MKRLTWIDFTVGGTCLFLVLVTMLLNLLSPVARLLMKGERVSGLLIGSDYDDKTRHSDTLMYVSYDPQSRFLDILSIPRDTQVSLKESSSVRRINEIFAYEFRHSGSDFNIASLALKSRVETLLSSGAVRPLEIPFYFTIDYQTFRSLIDALGGIYVKVTEPMHYDDNWGHLHIHFEPGTYLMNGYNALLYVRYRGANADQGRILRQQIFVKDVLRRLKSPVLLWSLPKYAKIVLHGIHTNFSLWDLFCLLMESRRMEWKNLRLFAVPGTPQGSLMKINLPKTQHILNLMTGPVTRHTPTPPRQNRAALETRGAATVEVWNASNRPNLAWAVVQLLRDRGFDVVKFGNFEMRQQRTLVIDRSGQIRPAQAVAEVLRSASPEVISRVDPTRQVDVSVILGNDASFKETKGWRWR